MIALDGMLELPQAFGSINLGEVHTSISRALLSSDFAPGHLLYKGAAHLHGESVVRLADLRKLHKRGKLLGCSCVERHCQG